MIKTRRRQRGVVAAEQILELTTGRDDSGEWESREGEFEGTQLRAKTNRSAVPRPREGRWGVGSGLQRRLGSGEGPVITEGGDGGEGDTLGWTCASGRSK